MSRLTPTISTVDAVVAMSEGNPGATMVLLGLLGRNAASILWLDELEIYGDNIWILYKDDCGENLDMLVEEIRKKAGIASR